MDDRDATPGTAADPNELKPGAITLPHPARGSSVDPGYELRRSLHKDRRGFIPSRKELWRPRTFNNECAKHISPLSEHRKYALTEKPDRLSLVVQGLHLAQQLGGNGNVLPVLVHGSPVSGKHGASYHWGNGAFYDSLTDA